MDVTVTGRRCSVSDSLREHVETRLHSVERLQDRAIRAEVEFTATDVKGSPDQAIEAEITLRSRGPVVRAEGTADEKAAAFERAFERLKTQIRKASDRRKDHHGLRSTAEMAEITTSEASEPEGADGFQQIAGLDVVGDGPLVVREKEFPAVPLTLAQALDEMELVGHDFFLFQDATTGRPSVVYRRKAYDYGVIHLAVQH
ncbi:MAG TPA: ribosome-associated translation inhibitor RaiA [Propionibacteriaceae bacterium]|nr:ribosome-associated translation inhibitor RaiA [Propionibacteriaceae bacterium]